MYSIATTSGFIIDSRPRGEAGKLLSIFTRDLGLILASAQGIRLEKSKLRYATQDYSWGTFSFVRGKEFWRLTNATDTATDVDMGPLPVMNDRQRELTAKIAQLLRRLLHGEEAHVHLFDHVHEWARYIRSAHLGNDEVSKVLESVIVFRILYDLGYISLKDHADGTTIVTAPLTADFVATLGSQRTAINKQINDALRASQL